ncbi:hypothetical protein BHM03_00046280 [Ensete ventricosum]|nr:hypothetical protein BHM03_00046280 [Ensete ventricosum]
MHPLRFPNSGIRAKVFVRKISFKLRVMRLNRVESFYAFLLRFRSEGSPCKGQPGMVTASPLAGAADNSQGPTARGRLAVARPPTKGDRPQGQQSLAGTTGCGQPAASRGGHPLARQPSPAQGQRQRRRTCVFLIYCWTYVLVIICNYMERRSGSVEVTAGPMMPWREITTHGDAMIRRNR